MLHFLTVASISLGAGTIVGCWRKFRGESFFSPAVFALFAGHRAN
jgi:hypothetical protein